MKRMIAAAVAAAVLVPMAAQEAQAAPLDFHAAQLPFLWPNSDLLSVSADGANSVWVAGKQGQWCVPLADYCYGTQGNPVVRRWTGSAWQEFPLNGWVGSGPISQVASGAGETWIRGYWSFLRDTGSPLETSGTYLARFDGTAFQPVAKPDKTTGVGPMSVNSAGVWALAGPGDETQEELYKWAGGSWTSVGRPDGFTYLGDVRALSATSVWVAGSAGSGTSRKPVLARYDGTRWTTLPSPDITGPAQFNKVVPVGPNEAWVITDAQLAHWNGSAWTVVPAPKTDRPLEELVVDGAGKPWVSDIASTFQYDDGTWRTATRPANYWVHDLAAVPGTSTLWGVGTSIDYRFAAALTDS